MQQVDFLIHGLLEDSSSCCSIAVDFPITLSKLKNRFPFEGNFHFRQKVSGSKCDFPDIDFLWIDIEENAEIISDSVCIDIQALAINVPECDDSQSYDEYLSDISAYIPIERPSAVLQSDRGEDDNNPISLKSLGKVINNISEGVKKGVESNPALKKNIQIASKNIKSGMEKFTATTGKVWKSVLVNASNMQQRQGSVEAHVTSPIASENLSSLSLKMATTFRDSNPDHMILVTQLWTVLFPGQNFKRNSPKWKEAGYQGLDPTADLKSTGLLSLYGLVFLGETYPDRLQKMVADNKANTKTNYPLAVVAVNLSMLLIELFHLRENRYINVSASYWDLFLNDTAFYEIFAILFIHMDNIWRARKAVRADFGKMIGEVKVIVKRILRKGPCSIEDFKFIAQDEGIADVS